MDYVIAEWKLEESRLEEDLAMFAEVLHAAVHGGASVSFVLPFSIPDAIRYWREKVLPGIAEGTRRLVAARSGGRIVGLVQLELAVPPNQQHRAEVMKLLVLPEVRRRGVARQLMTAVEEIARSEGRTLITLDTRAGDMAEPLYLSMGYILAGVIPRYARGPLSPELEATSILYKELSAP